MNIKEIQCKSAINRISKSRLPYNLDINIYRGCSHGCKYCYAVYSNKYLDSDNFFDDIFVKKNIVEILERELRKKRKREVINIGSVTDSYQPLEKKYKIMPDILKLMIKYKQPIIISTKSDLILRDIELIDELSSVAYVNIASTITVMNKDIQKKIEPGSSGSLSRINMLKEIKRTKAGAAIHMMPIIPYITDDSENIEAIFKEGKEINIDYILTAPLNLKGDTKKIFFNFVKDYFPNEYLGLKNLYKDKFFVSKEYMYKLNRRIKTIRDKYGISEDYKKGIIEYNLKSQGEQLMLL